MRRTVTIDDTTTLTSMTSSQLISWEWTGDLMDGTAPMDGYEVRDTHGQLLGILLCRGYLTGPIHVEWYDPEADDFFPGGETQRVLTQGVARVLEKRKRHDRARRLFATAA